MRRSPVLFLLLWLALLHLTSCGSMGGTTSRGTSSPGTSLQVQFRDPRVGMVLGVVNDQHLRSIGVTGETEDLRRANFYSRKRGDAMTKVASDRIVAGLVQALDSEGFSTYGMEGGSVGSLEGTVIEINTGGRLSHFRYSKGMPPAALEAYQRCRGLFMDVYNVIPQYQSADPNQIRLQGASSNR